MKAGHILIFALVLYSCLAFQISKYPDIGINKSYYSQKVTSDANLWTAGRLLKKGRRLGSGEVIRADHRERQTETQPKSEGNE